jgi:DUF4097 and DUF4098 domain-containing protein YvlB
MSSRFPIPEGARLKVLTVSGGVHVQSEQRADIEVEPERSAELSEDGHALEVRARSTTLHIRVPVGLNVSIGTVSGDIRLSGRFGTVKVSSVSGHVSIGDTEGDADIRSVSGHIELGDCMGRCRANTKSGHIELSHVASSVQAHTLSGHIEVGTAGQDEVNLKSISGRITVKVDPGRLPRLRVHSLSGRLRSDCPPGDDFEIKASTISGTIEVQER